MKETKNQTLNSLTLEKERERKYFICVSFWKNEKLDTSYERKGNNKIRLVQKRILRNYSFSGGVCVVSKKV